MSMITKNALNEAQMVNFPSIFITINAFHFKIENFF